MPAIEALRRTAAIACVWLSLAGAAARAQSTERLFAESDFGRFEVAAGGEMDGDGYSGQVSGIYGAYRAIAEGAGSWRLMGWGIRRTRRGVDRNGQPVEIRHRALVAAAGPEWRIALPLRESWAAAFGGLGYARLHSSHAEGFFSDFRPSDNGWAIVAGFGVTFRRVLLQQHIVVIHGAHQTLQVHREYYPIVVGVRF